MGGSRQPPRPGPHPGRRRIERAARLAPGAAGRDEGEGARALPRRGPPLLRGAGAMKRLRRLLSRPSPAAVGGSSPRSQVGEGLRPVAAASIAAAPPPRTPPRPRRGDARRRSTGCSTRGGSARRTTALGGAAASRRPTRPRSPTSTATTSSCAATTTAPSHALADRRAGGATPDHRRQAAGRPGASEARDADQGSQGRALRPRRHPLPGRRRRAGPLRARHAGGGVQGAARRSRASTPRCRSASSSIAARPIWRRCRRCRRRRSRAPARSRCASGRA